MESKTVLMALMNSDVVSFHLQTHIPYTAVVLGQPKEDSGVVVLWVVLVPLGSGTLEDSILQ